jgi:geranylgeranyl pyrophosphate synthase
MVGGQWLDLEAEGRRSSLADLVEIHSRKTGALITAACALGGLAAGADESTVSALTEYGRAVGLAFQIADDLLDATGTSEELGKTAGRDATLSKATYVSVLGLEAARAEAHRQADLASAALDGLGPAGAALRTLAGYIVQRRS